jgi:hypothetical protein
VIRFKYLIVKIVFIGLVLVPNFSYAIETLTNTGLVPSNIWFSKDPFYAGDKVRIYSVVFSGSAKDLRGRVNFYDNNKLLCTSEFASIALRISEVWCDWAVDEGKHNISIKITNPRASAPGETEEPVILSSSELRVAERVVVSTPISKTAIVKEDVTVVPVKNESKSTTGIIEELVNFFSGDTDNIKDKIVDELAENSRSLPERSTTVSTSTTKSKILKADKDLTIFDKTVPSNVVTASSIKAKSPLNFIAGIYPVLVSVKDSFYSFTGKIADFILPKLKAVSESDSKPIAYVMTFFYKIVKFILETPGIFAAIILASIWQIFKLVFGRRDDY